MKIERFYDDFFRPSREGEYERILKTACEKGYEFHTVLSFEDVIRGGIPVGKKYLILRRDIDTGDSKILRKMLDLEKKYGARATYYFRWKTLDIQLARDIEKAGGEASYHYEEIATYCYKHRIRNKNLMLQHIEEIKDMFIQNYHRFKQQTVLPCLTVSSHGDYVNTVFKYENKHLVDDRVRKECGIIREAYDPIHMDLLTCRIADHVEMNNFPKKAIEAIERGEPVLELLTHPRQWNSPFWINLKEEVNRACRGIYMRL